jgi:hypothetical protein
LEILGMEPLSTPPFETQVKLADKHTKSRQKSNLWSSEISVLRRQDGHFRCGIGNDVVISLLRHPAKADNSRYDVLLNGVRW